jgi:fatty acid desaturase
VTSDESGRARATDDRSADGNPRAPLTRADRLTLAAGVICLIAGIVLIAAVPGFGAAVAGACLLGLAGIAFVALAFLLIGEGEERDYRKGSR